MNAAVIAAILSVVVTVIAQLIYVIRLLSRLELKVDEMWAWFMDATREHTYGRRRYDTVPDAPDPRRVEANDEHGDAGEGDA